MRAYVYRTKQHLSCCGKQNTHTHRQQSLSGQYLFFVSISVWYIRSTLDKQTWLEPIWSGPASLHHCTCDAIINDMFKPGVNSMYLISVKLSRKALFKTMFQKQQMEKKTTTFFTYVTWWMNLLLAYHDYLWIEINKLPAVVTQKDCSDLRHPPIMCGLLNKQLKFLSSGQH